MEVITDKIFNTSVTKFESEGWKFRPSLDLTGYTLIYLIKESRHDKDSEAKKSLTPTFITENGLVKIIVEFPLDSLQNLDCERSYLHSLKAISANGLTAITVFKGKLTILEEYIENPVVEA